MKVVETGSNIGPLVDEMGRLKAQAADIELKIADVRKQLVEAGDGAYEGELFRATVVTAERSTLNMQAAREKLLAEGFHQFVKKNTKVRRVPTVSVVSRTGDQSTKKDVA